MTRVLLAIGISSLFVSCANIAPEDSPGRTPWTKKDETADKGAKTEERSLNQDNRGLVKSNEYAPGWQF